jgi:hypothetical protein
LEFVRLYPGNGGKNTALNAIRKRKIERQKAMTMEKALARVPFTGFFATVSLDIFSWWNHRVYGVTGESSQSCTWQRIEETIS